MPELSILTERLKLRLVKESDLDFVHRLHSRPEVDEYNTLGIPENLAQSQRILQEWTVHLQASNIRKFSWLVETQSSAQNLGLMGLTLSREKFRRGEVWYKFSPDFWGQGFATEALQGLIHFAFKDLALHRIEAGVAVENVASIRVMEKVGMQREGRKRESLPLKKGWSDNYEYGILAKDLLEEA